VFNKLRSVGQARTDGQTIRVEGEEHDITAHSVCTLKLVHVVTKQKEEPHHVRAMVLLEIKNHGYRDMGGSAHLLEALIGGLVVSDPSRPDFHSWRILPNVQVPYQFKPDADACVVL
jgi:hypothetical protein